MGAAVHKVMIMIWRCIAIKTKQQQQISVPPVDSISIISAAWRKAHTGCNFFQPHHSFAQLCVLRVPVMIQGEHVFQYVH